MLDISGWNTWDVRCLNGVMKIPEMAEIRVGLYNTKTKYYQDEFLWKNVKRFGFHELYGEYFDIDLQFDDLVFTLLFASDKDQFVMKVIPEEIKPNVRFCITGMFRWNADGYIKKSGKRLLLGTDDKNFNVQIYGKADTYTTINSHHPGVMLYANSPVYISCNKDLSPEEMDSYIESKRAKRENWYVKGGERLRETPEAIIKGIAWNLIYEPIHNRICTPVTRAWCVNNGFGFGSYVLFEWDTFFNGLLSGIQDKKLAEQQVYSILQEMTGDGMVPNFGSQRGKSVDRSQPPVGSYCILKLYRQFGDKALLENTFYKLLSWNKWWMKNRDGNGDGLLEWGSNPNPEGKENIFISNNHQAAMYESGLDNSPMYDDVVFNEETHTMEYTDVGLNALYALDCWVLSEIAGILGKNDIKERLLREYSRVKEAMNNTLWDEETGIYLNRHWDGRFNYRLSPTNFYPLLAGVASKEQAERMIKEHLLNREEFWGEYVIPSISRSDKAFSDNDYWRGRIWGPMNFLVGEGIKRYGYFKESYEFASKSLNLFLKEWETENHIHENYNAVTGDGDDVRNADPVYTWGGLLGYLAVSELIETQAWGAVRFGNLSGEKDAIYKFPIGNDLYDVWIDNGLTVIRNGKKVVESDVPVIILDYRQSGDTLSFRVVTERYGKINVFPYEGIEKVQIKIKDKVLEYKGKEITITF